ncbi:MAG: aldo/keto reductase [Bacteroidales bacterium]|nr:4Fe-4S dicluster domain-containing protein [Bacteroidales bacterium]MBS3775273.1 4Fe-4S dicluster domain-containing protein [Bacteroidales bacterium]
MTNNNSFERRKFLKLSLTAVLGGLTGKLAGSPWQESSSIIEEAAKKVGKLPRRKLGYSQRDISVLIGTGDMAQMPMEAGILCGMNYWHKANRWMKSGAPEAIIKNRDAHYCQVTVDRVGGNHYSGHFDEEEHYRYVKEALERTGLRYFDDMQLHFGYHNTEELKKDRSFVRAFERLKKEGLVKHLCLSQHSYDGSSRVENGESAAKILTAVVEDGIYEHAQFMYSYGDDPEMDKFIEFARRRNFGTIAMKTARGIGRMRQDQTFMDKLPNGTAPHNALVRWLTTQTMLDAAVVRVRNLEEFVETYSGAGKDLRAQETRALEMMAAEADRSACRMCGKCQFHCPQHIPIADILRFERYAMDDYDWNKASGLYAELPVKGDMCINCRNCVQACPLNLQIPEKLSRDHILLST